MTADVTKRIFDMVLQTGTYPDTWKTGINIPIFKSGDFMNPGYYRGITLTNALGKFFCQILNNRITEYLEDNDILSKEQAGFRKTARTSDHIFILKKDSG